MALVDREGTFRGCIIEKGLAETQKSGLPQFICELRATEYFDEETEQWVDWSEYVECEARGYFVLVSKDKKPTLNADQLKKALGWSGMSLSELEEMDTSDLIIQFRVAENTYNEKTSLQVSWIDHADADPSRSLRKLDKGEVKALDAKYAAVFKKYGDPPKPKGAPAKPKATPKKTEEKTEEKTEDAPKAEPKKRGRPPKPKISKPPKSPKPLKTEAPKKGEPAGVETLGLPEKCTEDEAWGAFEKYVPGMENDAREKVWFAAIKKCGDVDAVDADNAWATVRDVLLEQHSDQIVTA